MHTEEKKRHGRLAAYLIFQTPPPPAKNQNQLNHYLQQCSMLFYMYFTFRRVDRISNVSMHYD